VGNVDDRVARCKAIDALLKDWSQGDYVLGAQWFVHRFDPSSAITDASNETIKIDATANLTESPVQGLVVLTQTCDIVRSCVERAYITVAPLVEVDEGIARQIERGRRPNYADIPALRSERLVADLDRVMTVEKAIVATWNRGSGCRNAAEARRFAEALKRNRSRFAFPDDFVTDVAPDLSKRLQDKHDKDTDEGRALRALREVRITASPSWEAERVTLWFWFIHHKEHSDFENKAWSTWLPAWLKLVKNTDRFPAVNGAATTLADMKAEDYVTSDPLDLDYLSLRGNPA
jgi:hypothetical protein